MVVKLNPLIIFLVLLLFLILSVFFQNQISQLFVLGKEGYTDIKRQCSDIDKNPQSYSSSLVVPLNVKPVYDISGIKVDSPLPGTVYYDISQTVINFPKSEKVYDELGNVIKDPPLVGFMSDSNGNPLDFPLYDYDKKEIKDLTNYTGIVYNAYHNQLYFPYLDSDGNYIISPIMTPDIFKSYINLMNTSNSTESNKYSDISCQYGCVDFSQSLDDYISNYYQHFWNENKQIYTDDYILKSSIVPQTSTCDTRNIKYSWNDLSGSNNLGRDGQNLSSTIGRNVQAVAGGIGQGAQNVATTVGKDVQAVAEGIGSGLQNVATTVGGDIQAVAGGIGSALSIHPTNINNRGLIGNYNGDNSATNKGYMAGTNQLSGSLPGGVADFNNNYNAVPLKSSNFVPITSDFSKFGR